MPKLCCNAICSSRYLQVLPGRFLSCRRYVKQVCQTSERSRGIAGMDEGVCVYIPMLTSSFPRWCFLCSCLWAPPEQAGCLYWLQFFLWPLVSDLYMEIQYSFLAQDLTCKLSGNEGWQKALRSVWKLPRRIKLLPKKNISENFPKLTCCGHGYAPPPAGAKCSPAPGLGHVPRYTNRWKKIKTKQPSIRLH